MSAVGRAWTWLMRILIVMVVMLVDGRGGLDLEADLSDRFT